MEILAPVGNSLKMAKTAIRAGADALYFGVRPPGKKGRFSLLWSPFEMELEKGKKALSMIKAAGKKAYIAMNSFYPEEQLDRAVELATELYNSGADAMILSDPGFATAIKSKNPAGEIHVSVLGRTLNHQTALFWKEFGASRIILERMLSVQEMADIRQKAEIEIEVFVYGGFCFNYHGSCRISNYYFGEMCLAPCMDPANIHGLDRVRTGEYPFRSKPLNAYHSLPDLFKIGVSGIKIEGRQKNGRYLTGAVTAFRKAVDALTDGKTLPEIDGDDYYFITPPDATGGFYLNDKTVEESIDREKGARHFFQSVLPYVHPSGFYFAYKRHRKFKKAKEHAGSLPDTD